ncbi:hypothetical protein ANOBCDAF_03858 [Pleomorphomonas sp. T1.2MG-36]|uniref:DUF6683 family protein n=1 Tax=Pleomorphomonas sp. T1.2MG-36 TaxID=3041167 RepID=UPI002477C62E|nr:DUF6683 family protein [Pleomorphomonas sp. T1.2MG-36]CAI9416972.1 hypothetical protein ANOBCDAF_03858 [Pleomorphomonas sp. T1.2MG-36]
MTPRFARLLILVPLTLAAPAGAQGLPALLPDSRVISDVLDGRGGAPEAVLPRASATAYRASPEAGADARRAYAEWMSLLRSAESGRRVAAALGDRDPVRGWARIVGDDGLHPGDMADVVAGYWLLNWTIANGADSSREGAEAVRRQVRQMIVASPGFDRLDGPERQRLSEALMLEFLAEHAAYADAVARGDRAAADRLAEAAVARFRAQLGVDLRALRLTDDGFVRS